MEVRDVSRQTLSTIANSLGPVYLGYILTELRGALSKGYVGKERGMGDFNFISHSY
jgi:hypothetical protein